MRKREEELLGAAVACGAGAPGDAAGVNGSAFYEAIKAKVVGVLSACRRRFGQPKIDEVKQRLLQDMQQYCNNRIAIHARP